MGKISIEIETKYDNNDLVYVYTKEGLQYIGVITDLYEVESNTNGIFIGYDVKGFLLDNPNEIVVVKVLEKDIESVIDPNIFKNILEMIR